VLIVFNYPGLAMILVGGLVAFGGGHVLGVQGEPPLMIVLGVVVAALDVAYRLHRAQETARRGASFVDRAAGMGLDWVRPNRGGSLFFLPAWGLGALWIVLGVARIARGG
jgi:hypothetical protein